MLIFVPPSQQLRFSLPSLPIMPIFSMPRRAREPARVAPEPPVTCNHHTQTSISWLEPPAGEHIDHPVMICPRFWESLGLANDFKNIQRFGFSVTGENYPFKDRDYVIGQTMINFATGFGQVFAPIVPVNALSVSVAAENFLVGNNSFDFYPIDQPARHKLLTHQLINDRVQATYLNSDGVQYLAGICFVMRARNEVTSQRTSSCQKAFQYTWLMRRHYPDENITHDRVMYGRDCERLRKRVLVTYNEVHQKVVHVIFNNATNDFESEFCGKCNRMANTPSTYFAEKLGIPLFYPETTAETLIHDSLMQAVVLENLMVQLRQTTGGRIPLIDKAWEEANQLSSSLNELSLRAAGYLTDANPGSAPLVDDEVKTLQEAAEPATQETSRPVFDAFEALQDSSTVEAYSNRDPLEYEEAASMLNDETEELPMTSGNSDAMTRGTSMSEFDNISDDFDHILRF
uniref:Capsid protein n=2 Tax=Caenorhabditis tropicalis TaxID=1561998 RepID=A0A1I7TBR7_9PELO